MLLTLDDEFAGLVTDLQWADWIVMHTIAVTLTEDSEVLSAQVVSHEDDVALLYRLNGIRADHWSINELFMDLLCGVAYGFPMTRPTGSHRYTLAMLQAIRQQEEDTPAA
ncbi:MAG: hypothetical protein ACYDBB_26915 [Armatimonadota bacterium]